MLAAESDIKLLEIENERLRGLLTIQALARGSVDVTTGAPDLLAENERLRVALDHLQSWFTADLGGAFSNTEYLLGGCPNDLRAAIERARAALNVTP